MTEPPKKRILTGLDISKLSKVRPTRIPTALTPEEVHQHKINFRRIAIDAGILALIVLIAYGTSVIGGFVFNDHYIDKFLLIKASEESFWSNLIMRAIVQPLSQSWTTASFAFDMQNFAFDPSWYHIVNMIFHFLSCFYFYIFVYRLSRHIWRADEQEPMHELALMAAGLLACHPFACESVAHISGRIATITACNLMLTLNFFLWGFWAEKTKTMIKGYILAFVFFLLTIFSDWQAIATPVILLLLVFLIKPPDFNFSDWLKHKWADLLFVFLLVVLAVGAVSRGFTAEYSNGFALPLKVWTVYVASQFHSLITYYLRCALLPLGFSVYPPSVIASGLTDPLAILGLVLILLSLYVVYRLREQPIAAFALGMAILSFLPQILFVQNEVAADHRFYLSCAGLALLVAFSLRDWCKRWYTELKIKVFVLIPLVLLITVDVLRTLDFRSDISLFKAAVRVNKNDAWAHGMLALALVQAFNAPEGMKVAQAAIKIDQDCQPGHLALGRALMPTKSLEDILKPSDNAAAKEKYLLSRDELEKAFALAKSQHLSQMQLFETAVSLAKSLIELDEYKRANEVASTGMSINPNSILLNLITGRSLNGLRRYNDALTYLNRCYERDQNNPDVVEPLTEAALGVGTATTIRIAYNAAKLALRVKPNHNVRVLMAWASFEMTQYMESFRWIESATNEKPNDPKCIYLRSYQLQAMGQLAEAKKVRDLALKLEPDLKESMPIVIVNRKGDEVTSFEKLYDLEMARLRQANKSKPQINSPAPPTIPGNSAPNAAHTR